MWVADILTVTGLLLDVFGAVLLIGINWRWTLKFGEAVKPEFKRLDSALDTLGNHPRENLEPGDDGFDELSDVADIEPRMWSVPGERWGLSKIEAPDDTTGKAVFVFKPDNNIFDRNATEKRKIRMSLLDDLVNQHAQRWFIRRAVLILVFGFALQIAATVLPYVACFVLVFFSWLVIPFPIPVPVPLPLPGSGVCSL